MPRTSSLLLVFTLLAGCGPAAPPPIAPPGPSDRAAPERERPVINDFCPSPDWCAWNGSACKASLSEREVSTFLPNCQTRLADQPAPAGSCDAWCTWDGNVCTRTVDQASVRAECNVAPKRYPTKDECKPECPWDEAKRTCLVKEGTTDAPKACGLQPAPVSPDDGELVKKY